MISEETREKVIKMYNENYLTTVIASELGISRVSINKIIRDAGLEKRYINKQKTFKRTVYLPEHMRQWADAVSLREVLIKAYNFQYSEIEGRFPYSEIGGTSPIAKSGVGSKNE